MSITTVREWISAGASEIACKNFTYVRFLNQSDYPPKIIKGKPVYRKLLCSIVPPYSKKEQSHINLDDLPGVAELKAKGCWVGGLDFVIRERDLNHFISLNGGIDEYATTYWIDVKNDLWGELEEKDDEIWSNCDEDW